MFCVRHSTRRASGHYCRSSDGSLSNPDACRSLAAGSLFFGDWLDDSSCPVLAPPSLGRPVDDGGPAGSSYGQTWPSRAGGHLWPEISRRPRPVIWHVPASIGVVRPPGSEAHWVCLPWISRESGCRQGRTRARLGCKKTRM